MALKISWDSEVLAHSEPQTRQWSLVPWLVFCTLPWLGNTLASGCLSQAGKMAGVQRGAIAGEASTKPAPSSSLN